MTDTPRWIDSPDDLARRLADPPPRVGLDTEFIRERTWWPQLALVQLAIRDQVLLVDPLVPGMAEALRPLLADPAIEKVMHSAGEDLTALKRACGVVPAPLFDTQVAAAIAGVAAGIGYQRLVQDLLGVTLEKGETRSDWMRRPLSDAQLEYAADDVQHLDALHAALSERLEMLGRRAWFDEDCARAVDNARRDDLERWPHASMRAAQFLDAAGQVRLLRLLRWRDAYARETDRPRSWILDNDLAVQLARAPAPDAASVQKALDAHPKAPRKLGAQIAAALATPLDDERDAPPIRVDDRDRNAVRRLQEAVAARSAELGLPDGVLASRRWLEQLLDVGPGPDAAWPGNLAGWRRAQLEPLLAPLLATALPAGDASV